ncbi:site-specific tyrosine recombinase XerD [Acidithiobacillus sp.]|uniref:site-specific tyrosine recombinase XerD n=1 Tax=Acidithiobacillus sp. TaxID=1872118 RepID=UPI002639B386|nr:site-specific tyrosine recombinase XerD [Acidithiobacillus sp.]
MDSSSGSDAPVSGLSAATAALSAERRQIDAFLDALWLEKNLGENTLMAYRQDLLQLATALAEQELTLTTADEGALARILGQKLQSGAALRSVARLLSSVRRFYGYAEREGWVARDPSRNLHSPRLGRVLPHVLSETEIEALLAAPDCTRPLGLRDAAMLELMYACGLRVSELVNLEMRQVDLSADLVVVFGKGRKERLVPMGEVAAGRMAQYLQSGRPHILGERISAAIFVTGRGAAMTRQRFWQNIEHYAQSAGITQPVSPHGLRHAFATHLLNHGADLRSVQLMLGHANLSTTELYTYVAQARLKELHQKHHPRG